ncbi:MAG TPA: polysaccharide deacetylase family protein [Sporichthyaceae bacterium]|jgi:peptidoglycan/xylan/chitin deacetylase (PgdA/CDA1 family)
MTVPGELSRRSLLRGAAGLLAVAGLGACGSKSDPALAQARPTGNPTGQPSSAPTPSAAAKDPAEIKANELGLVPVMMFHRITETVAGDYDTTPAAFRERLKTMFEAGYRPVRSIDLAKGQLNVAAGYTPAVMSFDDGYPDQFAIDQAGNVDPATGIGIMLDVCKQFPDCPPAGSLNINKDPFGISDPAAQQRALQLLDKLGFEIANHTFNHDNLSQLSDAAVAEDLVKLQDLVHASVPGAAVRTMALPFGVRPHNRTLLKTGAYNGEDYTFDGVLLVGANPSASPFSSTFDPQAIPRIRNATGHGDVDYAATYWMNHFTAHPEQRYISAGNPGHVTVPKAMASRIAPDYRERLITY